MINIISEHRLTYKLNAQEFYISRDLPKPIESFKENPLSAVGVVADGTHRVLKATSDLLRLPQGESRQELAQLNGAIIPRTTEATAGAIGNVLGGIGNVFQGKFIAGPARVLSGAVDALDIPISAAADFTTTVTGVQYRSSGLSQSSYKTM